MTSARIDAGALMARGMTDPGPGEHLWMTVVGYSVNPASIAALDKGEDPGAQLLDHENVLMLQGPGCFKCEEPYSRYMSHRKCYGSMDQL